MNEKPPERIWAYGFKWLMHSGWVSEDRSGVKSFQLYVNAEPLLALVNSWEQQACCDAAKICANELRELVEGGK